MKTKDEIKAEIIKQIRAELPAAEKLHIKVSIMQVKKRYAATVYSAMVKFNLRGELKDVLPASFLQTTYEPSPEYNAPKS